MDLISGGLYLHIPFCRKKCLYCDFFSGGVRIADWEALTEALTAELRTRSAELPDEVVSIYFGGGTPSAMPPEHLSRLMSMLRESLGRKLADDAEITIEINPEDVTEETAGLWRNIGFNRASLGIQSFNDALLKSVGRRHSGVEALRALGVLKDRFDNISADLIFGLPGQTTDGVVKDLDCLIRLRPQHISVYSLMYEEGTALTRLKDTGRIRPVDEETSLEMFRNLSSRLRSEGYVHYEISNWALPGFESRHNSLYWKGAPYLGLGPSAHSYNGRSIRRANPPDIKGYLKAYCGQSTVQGAGQATDMFFTEENLSTGELIEEYLLTRLRLKDGFSLNDFRLRFGEKESDKLSERIQRQAYEGKLSEKEGCVSLTEEGIMMSDSVIFSLAQ